MSPGGHLTNLVGYEADQLYFNAPVGTQQITHSPYIFSRWNAQLSPTLRFYQAQSGATVFATGSMQWNWGLAQGVQSTSYVSPAAQQIMTNVLARLITPPTAAQCLRRAAGRRHQQHLERQHPTERRRAGRLWQPTM